MSDAHEVLNENSENPQKSNRLVFPYRLVTETSFEQGRSMGRMARPLIVAVACVCTLLVNNACRRQEEVPQPEYTTTATIKDIMLGIIDTSADDIWNAVQTVVGPDGVEEREPRTDEEWLVVRHAAIRLVEASNLLMIPGRKTARPHEKSETPGIELEPEEMDVLINQDRPAFYKRARALHDVAAQLLAAADAKDAKQLFEHGDDLEVACEGCHSQYWYPNQVLPPGFYGEPVPNVPPTGVPITPTPGASTTP
jgi:hypothetical protein